MLIMYNIEDLILVSNKQDSFPGNLALGTKFDNKWHLKLHGQCI